MQTSFCLGVQARLYVAVLFPANTTLDLAGRLRLKVSEHESFAGRFVLQEALGKPSAFRFVGRPEARVAPFDFRDPNKGSTVFVLGFCF